MNRTIATLALLFCFLGITLTRAKDAAKNFPQGEFRNPLAIPIRLAGGFGELRPNHFHTGIDIKTEGRENLPVYASADGYVSRITISHTGYGNCLYLTHSNGFTTVYGHLNDFQPELQKWVEQQQYRLESWAVDLTLSPEQFPVHQSDLIAFSGNTGGSTGPHLHFEIRETKTGKVLNELLFGLPVKDQQAPQILSLAVYNAHQSIYHQNPSFFAIKQRAKGQYINALPIIESEEPFVFLGVQAKDFMDGSPNWMGIYRMELYLDNHLQISTLFQELDFAYSRYANAYGDYKTKKEKGLWYQLLYRLPGNHLKVFPFLNSKNGSLDLSDEKPHLVRLILEDPAGNRSTLELQMKYKPSAKPAMKQTFEANQIWLPNQINQFQDAYFRMRADTFALYDSLRLSVEADYQSNNWSESLRVLSSNIPLQQACRINMRLFKPVPLPLRSKLALVHSVNAADLPGAHAQTGQALHYYNGWVTTKVKSFGQYFVAIDTLAPKVQPITISLEMKNGQEIKIRVIEETTSIKEFRAEVNAQWLRFVRRGNTFTYRIDDHCPLGKNKLRVQAMDENRNQRIFEYEFVKN